MVFYKGNRITGKHDVTIPKMVMDYFNSNASYFSSTDFKGSFLMYIRHYGSHEPITEEQWEEIRTESISYIERQLI